MLIKFDIRVINTKKYQNDIYKYKNNFLCETKIYLRNYKIKNLKKLQKLLEN